MTLPVGRDRLALVDPEDFKFLRHYHWHARKSKSRLYAVRKVREKGHCRSIFMHRQIMNCPPEFEVHHKNLITFDNRKDNLIVVSSEEHHRIHQALRIGRKIK